MTPLEIACIRTNVIFALTCNAQTAKGQLEGFEGFALARASRYGRQRPRAVNIDGRLYCRASDPVHVTPTMARKNQYTPITPEAYETAGLRRVINELRAPERAWVLRCYGYDMGLDHYLLICEMVWEGMQQRLAGKRVSHKMVERLIRLVELAVENTEEKCRNPENPIAYEPIDAAKEIGVALNNWSTNYKSHWRMIHRICAELDIGSLQNILVKCDL